MPNQDTPTAPTGSPAALAKRLDDDGLAGNLEAIANHYDPPLTPMARAVLLEAAGRLVKVRSAETERCAQLMKDWERFGRGGAEAADAIRFGPKDDDGVDRE